MKLGSFSIVAALVAGATGCVVRANGHVGVPVTYVEVDEEPPPPRVYVRDTRPGYVYIQGRWDRRGNNWEWEDGRWEPQRAGAQWEDGRWERRGSGHVWVEGRWSSGGGGRVDERATVRDHRDEGNHNDNDNDNDGGRVRDHRRGNEPAPQPVPPDGGVVRDHRR